MHAMQCCFGRDRGLATVNKVEALLAAAGAQRKHTRAIQWLYGALTILDSKASGLLSVNSILAAVATGLLTVADSPPVGLEHLRAYEDMAKLELLLFIGSSLFCLAIIRVKWGFLGRIKWSNDGYDFAGAAVSLARAMEHRTRFYWLAWLLTLCGFAFPFLWVTGVQLCAGLY
jgi:hypothetical protein